MTIANWGDEIRISPWAGSHSSPSVTTLTGGRLLIVWSGDNDADDGFGDPNHGIHGRFFHADGLPVGGGGAFLVNTTTTGEQLQPKTVGSSNGSYAVVWEDYSSGAPVTRMRLANPSGYIGNDEQWGNAGASRPQVSYGLSDGLFHISHRMANVTYMKAEVGQKSADNPGNDAIWNVDSPGTPGKVIDTSISAPLVTATPKVFFLAREERQGTTLTGHGIYASSDASTWTRLTGTFAAASVGSDLRIETVELNSTVIMLVWFDGEKLMGRSLSRANPSQGTLFELWAPSTSGIIAKHIAVAKTINGFAVAFTAGSNIHVITYTSQGVKLDERVIVGGLEPSLAGLPDGRLLLTWSTTDMIKAQFLDPRKTAVDLPGTSGDDHLIGTSFDDVIRGGFFGSDTLNGAGGNDTLIGGSQADKLDGGTEFDFASYATAAAAVKADLKLGRGTAGEADGDTFSGIEGLIGSDHDDELAGDDNNNELRGGGTPGGTDGGNDTLDGYRGDDKLIGEGGNDALYGREDQDTLLGGAGADWLDGGDGVDRLEGGSENDVLFGGAGADFVDGGEGAMDFAWYNSTLTGVDVDLDRAGPVGVGGTGLHGDAEGDQLFGIEGIFGSLGDDTLSGSALDNVLNGGGTNLDGEGGATDGGADTLRGRGGNDSLNGEGGNDVLDGGEGADTLQGGHGNLDFAWYNSSSVGVDVDLDRAAAGQPFGGSGQFGEAEGDVLFGIEGVFGSFGDDTLSGSSANNVLNGGGSNLTAPGGAIDGGNDKLYGRGGADSLNGEGGNDTLDGGSQDDWITGGRGDDLIDGGADIDTAVFTGEIGQYQMSKKSDGSWSVRDLRTGPEQEGEDTLWNIEYVKFGQQVYRLSETGTTPTDPTDPNTPTDPNNPNTPTNPNPPTTPSNPNTPTTPNLPTQPSSWVVLWGTSGRDTLVGQSGNERIYGLASHDVITGGEGQDRLYGGAGKDRLSGGAGQDVFVFDTKPNTKTNLDTITDFNVADDGIWLDNKVFKKLGKKGTELNPAMLNKKFFKVADKAKDKDDYLVYSKKTGILYYDADGSGAGKQVEIAKLAKNLKLTAADFFVI